MPPRFVYWTIIAGGLPTAFRATEREELQPTFQRIKEKHPDAEMKYFAQGKLWDSKEEAQQAREDARGAASGFDRKREWRPGGEHVDPRQKFKDAKKDRNQRWRAEKHEHKNRPSSARPPYEKPHGDPLRGEVKPEWKRDKPSDRPFTARPPQKREWTERPPKRDWQDRPPREKPHGDPLRRDAKPEWKKKPFDRSGAPPKRDPGHRSAPREGGWKDRPDWRSRAPAGGDGAPRRDWREKPAWARNQERQEPGPPKRFDREDRPAPPKRFDREDRPAAPKRFDREERPFAPKRPLYPKREAEPREPRPDREPRRTNDDSSRPPAGPPERGGAPKRRPFQHRSGGGGGKRGR
jgi:hypothetical protein